MVAYFFFIYKHCDVILQTSTQGVAIFKGRNADFMM